MNRFYLTQWFIQSIFKFNSFGFYILKNYGKKIKINTHKMNVFKTNSKIYYKNV